MKARYVVRIGPGDVGRRVSVRARTHDDPPASDTVGVLRSWEGDALTVERRDGTISRILQADLLAGRVVPDPPGQPRRPGRHAGREERR